MCPCVVLNTNVTVDLDILRVGTEILAVTLTFLINLARTPPDLKCAATLPSTLLAESKRWVRCLPSCGHSTVHSRNVPLQQAIHCFCSQICPLSWLHSVDSKYPILGRTFLLRTLMKDLVSVNSLPNSRTKK